MVPPRSKDQSPVRAEIQKALELLEKASDQTRAREVTMVIQILRSVRTGARSDIKKAVELLGKASIRTGSRELGTVVTILRNIQTRLHTDNL